MPCHIHPAPAPRYTPSAPRCHPTRNISGELGALASHVERKAQRAGGFGRASGRVDAGAGTYEPRSLASFGEWLGSFISTLLTRFAP